MKAKEGPRKWNSLALVLVIIPVIAIAQTVAVRDLGTAQGKAKSAADQATACQRALKTSQGWADENQPL